MSGQWEVVGKSKKDKQSGKTKKLSKNEMKKFVDNAPKVEDLLPLAQVKTLYAALDTNKEPPKLVEKSVKTKENEAKKAQKKPKEKKESAVKDNNKPPKTIEAAVALITSSDVQTVLEVGQMRFAEAPLVWLKGLASWLNTKLPVDHMDNVFTAKSWEYPLCLLSSDTRAVLKKALKEVPESAVQMFYDYCLTSMANDMTKGSPVSGYKMLLQLVATQSPGVAVNNLSKSTTLRHSYQNRPAIGCSIMWALGLAGFKDLSVGLRVWQSVMFPVYELRHYTHFVTDYLKQLLARHSTSKALTSQQYFEVLDAVFSSRQPATSEMKSNIHMLQKIVCNIHTDNRLHSLFEPLLSRLSLNNPPVLKEELVSFLVECLTRDQQSYSEWRQLYTKYLPQSAILLRQLIKCLTRDQQSYSEWRQLYTKYLPQSAILLRQLNSEHSSLSQQLPAKLWKDTVRTFKVTNEDMLRRRQKTEGLQECSRLCDALMGKMTMQPKSFPWKRTLFLLVLVAAGVVSFDVKTHGSFKESKTGVFLKHVGLFNYAEAAWARVQQSSQVAYRWGEANLPVYWASISQTLAPYLSVMWDVVCALARHLISSLQLLYQYCADKKPVVQQWMDQYAPGLITYCSELWKLVWDFGQWFSALVLKYLSFSAAWLQENVFELENLQRVTLEALNTTQTLAAQTFSWLNSKVLTESSKSV